MITGHCADVSSSGGGKLTGAPHTVNLLLILLSAVTRSSQEYFHLSFHWNMDIFLGMFWLIKKKKVLVKEKSLPFQNAFC